MKERRKDGKKVSIIIVDDHPIVRHGIAQLINKQKDMEITGEASSIAEGWDAIVKVSPDLVIVDLTLENESGLDLIRGIKDRCTGISVLVLSMHDESIFAERAFRAGASGYVMKHEGTEKLIGAIRRIVEGDLYASDNLKEKLLKRIVKGTPLAVESSDSVDALSNRELEVFQMIGRGLTTREIADKLHLSVKTIEAHRQNIKDKLGLANANELIRNAVQWLQGQG